MLKLPRGIRQRGTSLLVDVSHDGQRRTATVSGLDVEEAKRIQATLRAELLNGHATAGLRRVCWTLQEAFERTYKVFWKDSLAERTARRNGECALSFFGAATPLDEITCDDLDAYVEHLHKQGNSNATINRKLAAVSKIMRLAVERAKESGMTHRPIIHRQKEGIGRLRWLTQLEEQGCLSLLSQWSKDDHAEALIVLVDTGVRCGELWRITSRDCTFGERPVVLVWGRKNNTYRSVPMTTRVQDILKRRCGVVESPGPLFPYDNRWFEYTWDRMKVTMVLGQDTQFVPHALRHTCASRLIQRNVPLKVVQEWLGHKSITTTMRYSHLAAANLFEAAKVLEAV